MTYLLELNAPTVYKIPCGDCSCSYVGQTKRPLTQRIKEHKNALRLPYVHSGAADHAIDLGHAMAWDDVKVLHKEKNHLIRSWLECAEIIKNVHPINTDHYITPPPQYHPTLFNPCYAKKTSLKMIPA